MSEKISRRQFVLAPLALLRRQEYQPAYPEENTVQDDLNASGEVLDLFDPSQYDQNEFNRMTAIGISVALNSTNELFDRVSNLERIHPEYTPLPSDGPL